ncbi:MAG: penicillin-insensitive murein endopeptidase [Polyangiaceae bacterium]|nr:penicillin-insensitive murein endopeptidase [Polyangiaceae bacterium]
MKTRYTAWLPLVALSLTSACFGSPTPLAPGLRGSVGLPHHGVQTGAVELPVSDEGFVRLRPKGENHWARPRLVTALREVAKNIVQAHPGPPLVIGDLGAEFGGRIPRHNSHRSGRDVDLLWFLKVPGGAPVQNPGFVHLGPDGLAPLYATGKYLELDVERQWLLVKELLSSPHIGVQFLFVSEPVEALLIEYARARAEPPELIWRAETVMLQPGDSAPHDDHLHLRIACTPEEMVEGCEGGGPYWQWLPPPQQFRLDAEQEAEIAESDPPPDSEPDAPVPDTPSVAQTQHLVSPASGGS